MDTKHYLRERSESATAKIASQRRYTIVYAIRRGYFSLARSLLSSCYDPNEVDESDRSRKTPLIYCAYIKEPKWALSIAQNLLENGAKLQKKDAKSLNALHYCCAFGKHKLLDLFLKSLDFDLINSVDRNGNTCLHYAAKFQHVNCIQLLIDKFRHYKFSTIEKENLFGLKPTDFLTINEAKILGNEAKGRRSSRLADTEIIETCRNLITSYSDILSYENELKTQENNKNMTIYKPEQSLKVWPKTVPIKLKIDSGDAQNNEAKYEIKEIKSEQALKKSRSSSIHSYKEVLSSRNSEFSVKSKVTNIMKNYIERSGDSEIIENILLINKYELLLNTIIEKNVYDDRIERVESTLQQQKSEKSPVPARPISAFKAKSHSLIDNRPGSAFVVRKIETENVQEVNEPVVERYLNKDSSNGQTNWRWQMKHLLSHMEIRESPSYRKTFTPVVNSRIASAKEEPITEIEETRTNNQRRLFRKLSKQISVASVSGALLLSKKIKP